MQVTIGRGNNRQTSTIVTGKDAHPQVRHANKLGLCQLLGIAANDKGKRRGRRGN